MRVLCSARSRTSRVGSDCFRATYRDAKWIRKWVNRERSKHRGRKSSGSNSGSSSAGPTRGSVRMHSPEELQVVSASLASPIQAQATPDVFGVGLASTCPASGAPGPKLTVLPPARAANSAKLSGPGVPGSVAASPVLDNSVPLPGAYTWSRVSSTVPMPTPLTPQTVASGSSFTVPLRAGMHAYPTQAHDVQPSLDPSSFPASVVQYSLPCADAATYAHIAGSSVSQLQSGIPQPPAMSPPPFSADPLLLQAPGGLTASAAYLYQIFNESAASTDAPPEAAPFNSMFYFTSLTRPEDAVPELRMPLSTPAHYPVLHAYAHDAMPVSYQMRLSDLVGLAKKARQIALLDTSVSAPTSPPSGPVAQQNEKAPEQGLYAMCTPHYTYDQAQILKQISLSTSRRRWRRSILPLVLVLPPRMQRLLNLLQCHEAQRAKTRKTKMRLLRPPRTSSSTPFCLRSTSQSAEANV